MILSTLTSKNDEVVLSFIFLSLIWLSATMDLRDGRQVSFQ